MIEAYCLRLFKNLVHKKSCKFKGLGVYPIDKAQICEIKIATRNIYSFEVRVHETAVSEITSRYISVAKANSREVLLLQVGQGKLE